MILYYITFYLKKLIKMNIKSSSELVQNALKEINTITPDEALKLFNDGKCN